VLLIDDATLYRWKGIVRRRAAARGHIYVEPGDQAKLLLGSIAVAGPDAGLLVFELSERNRLSFALRLGRGERCDSTTPTPHRPSCVRLDAEVRGWVLALLVPAPPPQPS
jgi:hypothetical protein